MANIKDNTCWKISINSYLTVLLFILVGALKCFFSNIFVSFMDFNKWKTSVMRKTKRSGLGFVLHTLDYMQSYIIKSYHRGDQVMTTNY